MVFRESIHRNPVKSCAQQDTTKHYNDVIMRAMASQITGVLVVCSAVCSGVNQRRHQSIASLAFVRGIHRWPWIPLTKSQLRGKCIHLMTSSWNYHDLVRMIIERFVPHAMSAITTISPNNTFCEMETVWVHIYMLSFKFSYHKK